MSLNFYDGGAFAECRFLQYPSGLGTQALPFQVLRGVQQAQEKMKFGQPANTAWAVVSSPASGLSPALQQQALLEETSERTRLALARKLEEAKRGEEDFSGRSMKRVVTKKPSSELTLVLPSERDAVGAEDPGPIVRSPTKTKMTASGESEGSGVTVPFCIGNWHNSKKLIVPVDQRLALQQDDRRGGPGIGDSVMALAVAMQTASREVTAEQTAKEKARQEDEERRQIAIEAEEAERAKRLLEQNATRLLASSQRNETREQRLERIRLERDLREREKVEKQRQRLRAKAAARLNITVEALEADEQLLRTVEEAASAAVAPLSSLPLSASGGDGQSDRPTNIFGDDTEQTSSASRVTGGVFASAVISNEGIRQEMEMLAQMEASKAAPHDGLRLRESDSDEDSNDDWGVDTLMKKKKRHL